MVEDEKNNIVAEYELFQKKVSGASRVSDPANTNIVFFL